MNDHLQSLQAQVDNLYANINALRDGGVALDLQQTPSQSSGPGTGTRLSLPFVHPRFRGPTSSAFSFDVAKTTLNNMGWSTGLDNGDDLTQNSTPLTSPPLRPLSLADGSLRDPLWLMDEKEAVRLCELYEREIGSLYPLLNIDTIIKHAKNLYRFVAASTRSGMAFESRPEGVTDTKSCILKIVLACALMVEGCGQSTVGEKLFENVRGVSDAIMHSEAVNFENLPILALVGMYYFHRDGEVLSWRFTGQVVRRCIELGLHRREALMRAFPEEEERAGVVRFFWSVYVLDRRWSFGTGLPFVMQDADIDPSLPEPDAGVPYLNVMIAYSRIGGKVWRTLVSYEPASASPINKQDIGYLDYQVLQWQKNIPPALQLPTANSPPTSFPAMRRLQILLYLRTNQMRILIYRPVLHSANSIMENMAFAQTVVEVAKDSVRALTHLNQTTDIYRRHQSVFNYFTISAIAVLFLASCHAPVQFSEVCRDEFYMAVDLIKSLSRKSYVAKRLWRTIKGLKEIAPKLGLSPESSSRGPVDDPHSSAALAMAGLAGHEISDMGYMGGAQESGVGHHPMDGSPMNGFQMSHEMTNLFEAALGNINGNGQGYVAPGLQDGNGVGDAPVLTGSNAFGGEDELYRQMRDLF
ncbi:MAG: hypothetical protein M1818_004380 [Claussenomyces sp. TS43310]|nr:MAG: hypothetical protein M1818_004380 [Claussenomyces sp. TS43310]